MGLKQRAVEQSIDYDRIASTQEFKQIISDKKKFILPYTLFFLSYSLILPFIALETNALNGKVIGDISWAWLYGMSFIPVSLTICRIYIKKSAQFDEQVKNIIEKEGL